MDLLQAIAERHSVRNFQDRPISTADATALAAYIEELNAESGLHMQLILNEPKAFNTGFIKVITHYGKFRNTVNYVALIGSESTNPAGIDLEERCGYYGEHIVLRAQQMGLRTCWVAGTYKKVPQACDIAPGERIAAVIAIGYGNDNGRQHKSKGLQEVMQTTCEGDAPDWFIAGVEAALLAPTAVNQQKFLFTWDGETVTAEALRGPHSLMDLGIVKYHFEIGSGRTIWAG